jgi:arylsulfatase A-like enzyme
MTTGLNRRELLGAGAAMLLGVDRARSARGASERRPNVLFILADDMGYADLSCFGRPDYRTPRLDRLASEGLMVMTAYANSAVCSASRTALVTGRYQYRLDVGLYEPGGRGADYGIPEGHPTLPGLFQKLGYRTSLFGKWHLGQPPKFGPTERGYDYFFGIPGGGMDYFRVGGSKGAAALGLKGEAAKAAGGGCELAGATSPPRPDAAQPRTGVDSGGDGMADGLYENATRVEVPGYLTDLFADHAVRELESCAKSGRNFFISLHFNAPHWPWEGPGDEEASKKILDPYNADGGSIHKYAQMVGALDAAIGRVLDALERSGLARDTIVIFTSDNGGERFSFAWPFIGSKGELLEGGLRIPLIVRWPGRILPGSRSEQLIIHMDWLPTLMAAVGGAPDPGYPSDGLNLLPMLLGQQPTLPRKLFWRYKAAEQAAVREGNWKYLLLGGREFLFNIAEDERERANKRYHDPALFERLKGEWVAWNATMLQYPTGMPSDNPKYSHCWADHY